MEKQSLCRLSYLTSLSLLVHSTVLYEGLLKMIQVGGIVVIQLFSTYQSIMIQFQKYTNNGISKQERCDILHFVE